MIKLISQFDNEKMRASVATPTCGPCCSCCCCCIVTTLTTSIITARNLGRLVETQTPEQHTPEVKSSKLEAILYGFFLLPLALGAGYLALFSGYDSFDFAPALSIVAFVFGAGLYAFHKKYGLPIKTAILIFISTSIILVGEAFVWAFIMLNTTF